MARSLVVVDLPQRLFGGSVISNLVMGIGFTGDWKEVCKWSSI